MRNKILLILICSLALFAGGILYYQYSQTRTREFRVTFLNVGQGDAAFIQFSNGKKMLVDCGPNSIILSRLGKILPFWDRKIDYVLATHPDLDHYGGCVDVLKRYEVGEVITNGRKKEYDPYWREWNRTYRDEGAELVALNGHQTWKIGSSTLEFFSPDDTLELDAKADDSNNYSIVFKLTADNGETFLFTGDMETPLENALIKKYSLRADILKVGHHGSDTASGEEFLAAVQPSIAVISVGKNKFGHPSLRVIRHLERTGAVIKRTDEEGDIII